jgi:hypothetical protein
MPGVVLPSFMPHALRRILPFSVIALAVYLALAVAVFWNVWEAPTERWLSGGPDPPLFIWHLRWLPFALGDGHFPLHSDYLNYPAGFNLMWNSSVIFPAFALTPVTLPLGAIFSFNLLDTLSLALSAWCAYLVFRRYVRRREAAAIGGLLYGFSPFMFTEAGHPHVSFALYPPIVLLLLDEIFIRQRRSPYVMGLLLAAATFLQLLTGEELVALSVLSAGVGVVLLALLHRHRVRSHLPYAARAIGAAGALVFAVGAYPLFHQLTGPQRVTGPIQPHGVFILDVLQFVVPTPRQQLRFANHVFERFSGPSELGGYIGLPLLLLTAFVIMRFWSDRLVRFASLLLFAVVILGLGPRLHVAGHVLSMPLPWVVPQRIPLFEDILPARFALIMFLLLGLLLAVFIDRFRLGSRGRIAALAAIVVVALVPLLPALPYPWTSDDTPEFFSSGADEIPKNSVALLSPLASALGGTSTPMVWQAKAAMRFRMPEGYIFRAGARFDPPDSGSALFSRMIQVQAGGALPPVTPEARRQILCQLERQHVRSVVVGPMLVGRRESIELFRQVLGRPVETGGVQLWQDVLVAARGGASGCA